MNVSLWPMVGLGFGVALGLGGAIGGVGGFVAVLIFGVLGFLAGRVAEGELDLGALFQKRSTQ
ncbi:hypothetical protein [Bailinhaonella thermotolerans]|uniref:DUF2273 domain-containing protein n=1 Tax=Bailinhaonella thermotolerans TaxID=1070861 RepID=A0A3A4AUE3_9ACTN|nr:hypothetical protein [Bailinhaonella thermotolerans]RJL33185.1 hypothetical protein D5H75_10095 [Bailinhaonella thermotolerans]